MEPSRAERGESAPETVLVSPAGRAGARGVLAGRPRLRAVLGGLCIVLGFPPFDLVPLLFVGLFLVLGAIRGASVRGAAWLGFFFGLTMLGGGFFWMAGTVARFYRIFLTEGQGGALTATALGVGAFLVWWLTASFAFAIWGAVLALGPRCRGAWVAWCVATTLAIECLWPRVFPWNFGAGVQGWSWFAQAAWWCGVLGVSAGAVLVAACAVEGERAAGRTRRHWGLAAVGLLVLWGGGGALRLASEPLPTGAPVRIGYVQANISLERRHSRDRAISWRVMEELEARSRALYRDERPDVVVWSEGMLPVIWPTERVRDWIRNRVQVPLVIGGLGPNGDQVSNRAYLCVDLAADSIATYDKRVLVPFGEEFPLRGLIEGLGIPIPPSSLVPGTGPTVVEIAGVPISPSICFEGITPIAHDLRESGARLHLNLTEDLWYGRWSAPYQHLALTRMRAIEAGMPLVRITNGGVSAVVDRRGRFLERIPLGGPIAGVVEVPVPDHLPAPPFPQAVVPWLALALLPLAVLAWRERRAAGPSAAR